MSRDNVKKTRGARCTAEQYAQMVNFIEQNKILVLGKTSPEQNKECQVKWKELSVILNGFKGAQKTPEQWKRTFVECKSKVKAHARSLQLEQRGTGGGTKNFKDLTETEEKLMSIIGWVIATGDPQLGEPGINATINEARTHTIIVNNPNSNPNKEQENDSISNDNVGNEVEATTNEIQTPLRRKTSKKVTHKKKDQSPKINLLRTAATIYEKNSDQLCKSLDKLANSINALAAANENIANYILQAEKFKE